MTRVYLALGYASTASVLALSGHRVWAGVIIAAAVGHLSGKRSWRGELSPTSATLDHVIPHSQGGTDDMDNLVTCCWRENRDKGNRTPEEWRAGVVVDTIARERTFIPVVVRQAVYARDGYRCVYCRVDVS